MNTKPLHNTLFAILLTMISAFQVTAQVISGRVTDAISGDPVWEAFIFIENSSIGTTSDSNGHFRIDLKSLAQVQLRISHLAYQDQTVPVERGVIPQMIKLQPTDFDLNEVEVHADKSNKRKGWLKRFEDTFLGKSRNRKHTTIVNPEVILFQEDEFGFTAQAAQPIIILNEALGYRIRFYLTEFNTVERGVTRYAGKAFFEEYVENKRKVKQVMAKRAKTYANSQRQILRLYASGDPPGDRFAFGLPGRDYYSPDAISHAGGTLPYDIYPGQLTDTIASSYFRCLAKRGSQPGQPQKNRIGHLLSHSGQIIVDKYGNIINKQDIEESGYWARHRVADLLPVDYLPPSVELTPADFEQPVAVPREKNLYMLVQEKIFVHHDKSLYYPGEEIWFKIYLVNAATHMLNAPSKVVYVDLIAPTDSIVASRMLHIDNRNHGQFTVDAFWPAGTYRLRAYTNWMRNFDEAHFFTTDVYIHRPNVAEGPITDTFTARADSLEKVAVSVSEAPVVQFYPEGGDLVVGLPSEVAIKVTDSLGFPVSIEGILIDQNGRQITTVKSNDRGYGKFTVTPEMGSAYYLKTHEWLSPPLPAVRDAGHIIRINNLEEDHTYIHLNSNHPNGLMGLKLLAHLRGQVISEIDELRDGMVVKLFKENLPAGIVHLTLFDPKGKAVCERLFFNDNGLEETFASISTHSLTDSNQSTEVTVSLDEAYDYTNASLSMVILDKSIVHLDPYRENLASYFLLNADLKGHIASPGFYLSHINRQKRYLLDLIMMTHGWSRFNWDQMFTADSLQMEYANEAGYAIRGTVTKADNAARTRNAEVWLSGLSREFYMAKTMTGPSGTFHFRDIPGLDTTTFMLQGKVASKDGALSEGRLKGNRFITFHLDSLEIPRVAPRAYPARGMNNRDDDIATLMFESAKYDGDWLVVELPEVAITARTGNLRRHGVFDLDNYDHIHGTTSAYKVISTLNPRFRYLRDVATGTIRIETRNRRGEVVRYPLLVFVDRQRVFDHSLFTSLTAADIKFVGIAEGVISITTRSGGWRQTDDKNYGVYAFMHPGYSVAKEFNPPHGREGSVPHDLFGTVFWSPNLDVDHLGAAMVQCRLSDARNYKMVIQGVLNDGTLISHSSSLAVTR